MGVHNTVQTYKTEKSMLTNVMKIRINDSGYSSDEDGENNAALLDIFPMSDVPNSKWLQSLQNKLAIFVNNVIYAKIGYITPTSRTVTPDMSISLLPQTTAPTRVMPQICGQSASSRSGNWWNSAESGSISRSIGMNT